MSVEMLQTLSLASLIASVGFLILTVVLFFVLKIPQLIGDVTGATARKAIENIRQQNEQSGDKAYKPSPVNAERGRLTDKISASGRLIRNTGKMGLSVGTEKLGTQQLQQEAQESQETSVLTSELYAEMSPGTTVLSAEGSSETTLLNSNAEAQKKEFIVEVDLGFCESAEIIE